MKQRVVDSVTIEANATKAVKSIERWTHIERHGDCLRVLDNWANLFEVDAERLAVKGLVPPAFSK